MANAEQADMKLEEVGWGAGQEHKLKKIDAVSSDRLDAGNSKGQDAVTFKINQ